MKERAQASLFEARPSSHDEVVAFILTHLDLVKNSLASDVLSVKDAKTEVRLHHYGFTGFIDILATAEVLICDEHHKTGEVPIIIEVKSERENWSAGDVIRQLKSYKTFFGDTTVDCDRCNFENAAGKWRKISATLVLVSSCERRKADTILFSNEGIVDIRVTNASIEQGFDKVGRGDAV